MYVCQSLTQMLFILRHRAFSLLEFCENFLAAEEIKCAFWGVGEGIAMVMVYTYAMYRMLPRWGQLAQQKGGNVHTEEEAFCRRNSRMLCSG